MNLSQDQLTIKLKAYLEKLENNNQVKIIKEFDPNNKNITVIDISLHAAGQEEDNIFIKNNELLEQIHRGNSLLLVKKNQDSQNQEKIQNNEQIKFNINQYENLEKEYFLTWGRRGQQKFFDLDINNNQNQQMHELLEKLQFGKIRQIYSLNQMLQYKDGQEIETIQIIRSEKANGENAQISYNKDIDQWVIGSKNVTIVCKNKVDIDKYKLKVENQGTKIQNSRYNFSYQIGVQWFYILERLAKEKIEDIKNFLGQGYTFVGEFVGNKSVQHLVEYQEANLKFFSIVKNQVDQIQCCLNPFEAQKILSSFNLDFVKNQDLGFYQNFDLLNKSLNQIFEETEKMSLEEGGEGFVLYLVNQNQVVSVCKLKTLEYRIVRKLREKLRKEVQQKKKCLGNKNFRKQNQLFSFFSEISDKKGGLCKNNSTSKPLKYFEILAYFSFIYLQNQWQNWDQISPKYVQFLEFMKLQIQLEFYEQDGQEQREKIEQIKKLINNKNLDQVFGDGLISENIKKLNKNFYNDELNYENLIAKINQNGKFDSLLNFYHQNYFREDDQQINAIVTQKLTKLVVLLPIGLPGCGKSFLKLFLKQTIESEEQNKFFYVSSDEIRAQCAKKYLNQGYSEDESFNKCKKEALLQFNKQIKQIIWEIGEKQKEKVNYLFIDKNNLPNNIENQLLSIRGEIQSNINLQVYPIIQRVDQQIYDNFFGLDFLIHCIYRVFERKGHENLQGGTQKSLEILLFFYHFFRNFGENQLEQLGCDKIFEYEFVDFSQFVGKQTNDNLLQLNQQKYDNLKNQLQNILNYGQQKGGLEHQLQIEEFLENFNNNLDIFSQQRNESQVKFLVNKLYKQIKQSLQELDQQLEETKEQQLYENQQLQQIQNKYEQNNQQFSQVPLYYAIFMGDQNQFQSQIQNELRQGLGQLKQIYKDQRLDFDTVINTFSYPKDGNHLTILFNNQFQESYKFQNCEQNLYQQIKIYGFLYVPDCIITGLCFKNDYQKFKIENWYPHVTLMNGKWQGYKSNVLLNNLFRHQRKLYDRIKDDSQGFMEKQEIKMENNKKKYQVYLKRFRQPLCFDGVTKILFK
ncbi:hypothetical protein PPERSA_01404 [Pseudocohnilembus persalinus]|uniref:DUF7920 domain-containing protein n=1 Tax=Pseudocohnilembus persalinus TaxID=266149 RepID=A0A0V0QGZ5_PSEPJ|nr:hypothetical protein PPERSA_01404 [Pseudocohnilembus persalinus]|eukprot:KRX01501.1 hypothetical protein PPERSA_01404 [Pseudocohnilembus persalinus]